MYETGDAVTEKQDLYLTFTLDDTSFGMELSCIKEIVGMQPITGIPEAQSCVMGIINLRGQIIPVMDLRVRLGVEPKPYYGRTCIIVADIQGDSMGLLVDQVSEVLMIDERNIVPPPDLKTGADSELIRAIGKTGSDVKLLLDCKKLFMVSKSGLVSTK